ncbi:MAG: HEAT repeat domain-containing protein, partial [Imperialibacter sp.]
QTLNTDENVNVRMVTVEALARFGRYPEVRQALVSSISKQSSPMVQIALAEAMVALNEKGAVEALKGLLEKDDLNDIVRQKVQQSIEVLT